MIDLTSARDLARAVLDELARHLFPGAAPVHDHNAAGLCAVPHCGRRAQVGQLCAQGSVGRKGTTTYIEDGGHFAQLGAWLNDIQTEAARLTPAADPEDWAALPSMASRWSPGGGGSLASQQTPAVLDAIVANDPRTTAHGHLHVGPVCLACPVLLAHRCTCPPLPWRRETHYDSCRQHGVHNSCADIIRDRDERGAERLLHVLSGLHQLAQRVRDERMLGIPVEKILVRVPPGHEGPYVVDPDGVIGVTTLVPAELTIRSERKLLTKHLDWIAAQPWAMAAREQIGELRTQLLRLNRNNDEQPLTGYCYRIVDDRGTQCRGNLWPVRPAWSTDDDVDEPRQPSEVVCDRNPAHRWKGGKGGDLARLVIILERQRREDAAAVKRAPALVVVPPLEDDGVLTYVAGQGGRLDPVIEEQRRRAEQQRGQ